MTLADLSNLGSFISALAVAGSLIYLGLQTHQAAKHTRALIAQNRTTRQMDYAMRVGEADFTIAIIAAMGGTPTPEAVRRLQFANVCTAAFASADETFLQHEEGLLNEEQFGTFRGNYSTVLSYAAYRHAWGRWKAGHPDASPRFIAFMDDIVAKTAVVSFDAAMRAADTASAVPG